MVTKQMKETTQVECILVKGDTTYNQPFSSSQHHRLQGCMNLEFAVFEVFLIIIWCRAQLGKWYVYCLSFTSYFKSLPFFRCTLNVLPGRLLNDTLESGELAKWYVYCLSYKLFQNLSFL